ncbi:DUF4838 domain-containing protein [Bacteroidales bacterium OttesenSCG-928-K03]|nr:DUF4838 domain-containing protein [Bacteroidales bacterium OttesenSCG-928-L14]MDL2242348.1 DUF4838 domain-containing protein [Bacteroidales bacterium OttesenSCG-928-K03]
MRLKLLFLIFLFSVTFSVNAQITIVKNGIPKSHIVVNNNNEHNMEAAILLQDFIIRISGTNLQIINNSTPNKGDIAIGFGNIDGLTEDGFRLETKKGILYISSGGDKGAIYGVVTLLENHLGVSYYASNTYTLNKSKTIIIPELNSAENPAFRYRQTQNYAIEEDSIFKYWFRFEKPKEVFANNLWVHTFNDLLPSSKYGATNPEYYSFINGEHRPGRHSQWCLTNPDVFEIVSQKIDSIFKANPDKNIISVSQNDGNNTNCTCPKCKALDEYEGSPSGTIIHFVNKLAERFPDKEISTLAYVYTMHPPKHVKPLPNVNIMLCNIDCTREVPLTDNASGQEFMKALNAWSAISNNIFIWDYGINFDNYVSPFPNFHIIQKNIQIFKEHNATMHFSQTGGVKGGDFSEMRAYIISKLMWNPYLNADSLMRTFLNGYYGVAAPYIYQYEKMLEGALLASKKPLRLYDTPVTHKDGMLNANCLKHYNELFDKAEQAVADDTVLLNRVQLSRLPIQYAELEIARVEGNYNKGIVKSKLLLFNERTSKFGVKTLNEKVYPPAEYCQIYSDRYLSDDIDNLAKDAKIIWITEPYGHYKDLGETALTDGLLGGTSFNESWVGWLGIDGIWVLDLGEEKEISSIEGDFLHHLGAWIFLPSKVTYSTSCDNITYEKFGEESLDEDKNMRIKFVGVKCTAPEKVSARYIKIEAESIKRCPDWHYGIGYDAWFFIDEITVQ